MTDTPKTTTETPAQAGIVPHGSSRFEYQAGGRRVAVFDRLEDARLFAAARDLLDLARRVAEMDTQLLTGISAKNLNALSAAAREAIARAEGGPA